MKRARATRGRERGSGGAGSRWFPRKPCAHRHRWSRGLKTTAQGYVTSGYGVKPATSASRRRWSCRPGGRAAASRARRRGDECPIVVIRVVVLVVLVVLVVVLV